MTSVPELLDRIRAAAPTFGGATLVGSPVAVDQLALAIADVAAHYGHHVTREQLTSGLPLVGGLLPLEHSEAAARRAGLKARLVTCDLNDLNSHEMPVLVLTADNGVRCLVEHYARNWSTSQVAAGERPHAGDERAGPARCSRYARCR